VQASSSFNGAASAPGSGNGGDASRGCGFLASPPISSYGSFPGLSNAPESGDVSTGCRGGSTSMHRPSSVPPSPFVNSAEAGGSHHGAAPGDGRMLPAMTPQGSATSGLGAAGSVRRLSTRSSSRSVTRLGLPPGDCGKGGCGGWDALLNLSERQGPDAFLGAEVSMGSRSMKSDDSAWTSRAGSQDGQAGRVDSAGTMTLAELELLHDESGRPWLLGSGNFGAVYRALLRGKEEVAVKVFEIGGPLKEEAAARREVELLKALEHPNVVSYKGACLEARGHLLLVMELLEQGDLRAALSGDIDGELQWRRNPDGDGQRRLGLGRAIATDIAQGLAFIHESHIVHLDLKSPNVLLTAELHAKIADVGLARLMPNDYLSQQAAVGTFVWSAPEVLMGGKCSNKVDVFSLGVILHELITGDKPKRGHLRHLRVPEDCPQGVANLVAACIESKPVDRPTARQVADLLAGPDDVLESYEPPVLPPQYALPEPNFGATPEAPYAVRKGMADQYDALAAIAWGSSQSAAAAGYVPANVETVVQDIRPCDALFLAEIVTEMRQLLEDPDVENPECPARQRIEYVWGEFRKLYVNKIEAGARLFNIIRTLDLDKLADVVTAEFASGGATLADLDAVGQERLALLAGKGIDSVTARLDTPASREKWAAVLDAAQLSQEQQEAIVDARQRANRQTAALFDERRRLLESLAENLSAADTDPTEGLKAGARLHANIAAQTAVLNKFQVEVMRDIYTPLQHLRAELKALPGLQDGIPISDEIIRRREAASAKAAAASNGGEAAPGEGSVADRAAGAIV